MKIFKKKKTKTWTESTRGPRTPLLHRKCARFFFCVNFSALENISTSRRENDDFAENRPPVCKQQMNTETDMSRNLSVHTVQ